MCRVLILWDHFHLLLAMSTFCYLWAMFLNALRPLFLANDAKIVVKFLRENILARFGMPRAIISDQGTHFNNRSFDALLKRYLIVHRLATSYHPQTSSQVEVSSGQIK